MAYPGVDWPVGGGGGGGGGSVSSRSDATEARQPGVVSVQLPRTAGEVRGGSDHHTLYLSSLPDDHRFAEWIVLIPAPSKTADDPSAVLLDQREEFGVSLPSSTLLVTLVRADGNPDRAAAKQVLKALKYERHDAPLLIFLNKPELVVRDSYQKLEKSFFRSSNFDGLVIPLGGAHPEPLKILIEKIPAVFRGGSLNIGELERAVLDCRRASRRQVAVDKGKSYGMAAATILAGIGRIIIGGNL